MTPSTLRTLAQFHSGLNLVANLQHAEDVIRWLDVAAACNYRNLRPLWRSANRSKRATVLPEAKALFDAIRAMLLEGKA